MAFFEKRLVSQFLNLSATDHGLYLQDNMFEYRSIIAATPLRKYWRVVRIDLISAC
jgi:hypothetical protein